MQNKGLIFVPEFILNDEYQRRDTDQRDLKSA